MIAYELAKLLFNQGLPFSCNESTLPTSVMEAWQRDVFIGLMNFLLFSPKKKSPMTPIQSNMRFHPRNSKLVDKAY